MPPGFPSRKCPLRIGEHCSCVTTWRTTKLASFWEIPAHKRTQRYLSNIMVIGAMDHGRWGLTCLTYQKSGLCAASNLQLSRYSQAVMGFMDDWASAPTSRTKAGECDCDLLCQTCQSLVEILLKHWQVGEAPVDSGSYSIHVLLQRVNHLVMSNMHI